MDEPPFFVAFHGEQGDNRSSVLGYVSAVCPRAAEIHEFHRYQARRKVVLGPLGLVHQQPSRAYTNGSWAERLTSKSTTRAPPPSFPLSRRLLPRRFPPFFTNVPSQQTRCSPPSSTSQRPFNGNEHQLDAERDRLRSVRGTAMEITPTRFSWLTIRLNLWFFPLISTADRYRKRFSNRSTMGQIDPRYLFTGSKIKLLISIFNECIMFFNPLQ
ncbi:uncharacterized protein LOC143209642 isoform X1 [Lasioglossum baleicum]|uniref:uncharacterized protein LOC143209642 isoform X1 n=1 Tax=Lasioglossum baleicum TaxID=434251 RepID=UPI003FCE9D1B